MKKITILIIAVIIGYSAKADIAQTMFPPIINEIYFDSLGNWTLVFNLSYYYQGVSIVGLNITTSSGESFIISDSTINGSEALITNKNLRTPLTINPQGDYIQISGLYSDYCYPSINYICFGNQQYSEVSPIKSGQSYKIVYGMCAGQYGFFNVIKEDHPLSGNENFTSTSHGVFTGTILDCDSIPVPNAKIEVNVTAYNYETHQIYDPPECHPVNICPSACNKIVTPFNCTYEISADNNGHFRDTNLYGRNYVVQYYSGDKNWLYDTIDSISIEPDTINNFNFMIGCKKTFVGVPVIKPEDIELSSFPNPTSDRITVSLLIKNGASYNNAIIKLFTSEGDLIKIIPVEGIKSNEKKYIEIDLSEYAQGNYYYNLEIDGKKMVTRKVVVVK